MEIETTATALPSNSCNIFAVPAQETDILEKHVSELKNRGFPEKKIRKLLARSGGNYEVVKAFLEAQRNLKESTKASKSQKKQEKRQQKHEKSRKERGKEHKMARKRDSKIMDANATPDSQFLPLSALESWPKDIRRVYLDGNNMLFVLAPLRNMCIKRNMKGAEIILHSMARKFCEALQLEECVLYFDDTHNVKDEGSFKVRSAKPGYATTDIALVELAKTLDSKAVYVTSDRELISFLKEQKGIISRPKDWFNFVARLSGSNDQLDTWAEKWTESITQSLDKLSM